MRSVWVALFLIVGAAASSPRDSRASYEDPSFGAESPKLVNARMSRELRSRAASLGAAAANTDTTYIGLTPEAVIIAESGSIHPLNYWRIWAGHGKDGYHRPTEGVPHKGMWDWENPVHGDSLQGWWPIPNLFTSTGGQTRTDRNRAWWAIDIGNMANYVPNGNGAKGTFGVDGVWHVDGGSLIPAPGTLPSPSWTPLGGAKSAWMGLRAHGDDTHIDPLTGSAFNEDVLQWTVYTSVDIDGADQGFPGYGSQMDQMLYRDIDMTGRTDQGLTISFKYRTNMSLSKTTLASTRTGWFNHDPLAPTSGATNPQLNNFISSSDAGDCCAPVDSFMVYVGAGVDGNQWMGSDGVLRDVYDPKHRWFAEVLHCDHDGNTTVPPGPLPLFYKQLLSVAGDNVPQTATFTMTNAEIAPYLAKNPRLRLVFRVKTNRGNSDDQGPAYSSGQAGAAVVDDVTYQVGAGSVNDGDADWGTFESASAIDNDPNVSAVQAWKSTGKPPAIYHHVHAFATLTYDDICGQKGDDSRICNMTGVVISAGDHDRAEAAGGPVEGAADREMFDGIISPTIILADDDGDPNTRNPHGLYGRGGNGGVGDIEATEDIYIDYEAYTGVTDPFTKGVLWVPAVQSYPSAAKDSHGAYPVWGSVRIPAATFFNPDQQCFRDLAPALTFALIRTTNASGIPDSIRIMLRKMVQCFRFGVSTGCGSTDGLYWDNISLTLIDGPLAPLYADYWHFYNDAFPANEDSALVGVKALFDTTTAYVRTGFNISSFTHTITRAAVPGDSMVVWSTAETRRVDMVFRVLPGPGNYEPVGQPHVGGILKRPDGLGDGIPGRQASDLATPGDGSWWGTYMAIPGPYSNPPSGPSHPKGGWNPNAWVSARCDTAEFNLYALQGRGVPGGPIYPAWMSTYHEDDPRYGILGIDRYRCFVRCSTCPQNDIVCDGTVPTVGSPGGYVPVGTSGTTQEGTKIIPDGLLTPGSHVQYFFRSQSETDADGGAASGFSPETSVVFPQVTEGSTDGHRWQQFGVLPDRWKDPQYFHPVLQRHGRGPACLLVVDNADRRGNERVWVSIADTIGATEADKYGAHNGWHARGDQDLNDPAARVFTHAGQPGTTWDLYQVKASEASTAAAASLGSRLSDRGNPILAPKASRAGPTPEMLKCYYTLILIMTGDLSSRLLGPYTNRSQDDSGILIEWLSSGHPDVPNRGIWAIGDGFVQDLAGFDPGTPQRTLIADYFGADLVSPSYSTFSGNTESVADLLVHPEWQGRPPGAARVYGVRNLCLWTNDVLAPSTPSLTSVTSEYRVASAKTSPGGPYVAGIFKDWHPASPWMALVDGWDIEHLATRNDANTIGRSAHFHQIFTHVWARIWRVAGTPVVPLDVPGLDDGGWVNFLSLHNNPLRAGHATIRFGLARADRVEVRVYDVSGRLIRTLADREFQAGPHELLWDGSDDSGRQVARGVYFTRVKHRGQDYEAARKLIVLK